ncbi:MAG: FG-GAP-like repeat-containing protein [Ignavibacteriota bacterium]
MKKVIVCCLLFVLSSFVLAQSKEERIQQLINRKDIKVTEVEKDILKLEYPNGKVLYKNIADYKYLPLGQAESKNQQPVFSPTYDSTIIDLTTIDTTLYYQKYKFWQEVPINNWDFECLRIGDVNNNGKPELYGTRKFFTSEFEPITVYELNNSEIFDDIFQYDSVFRARSIYDVDRDGKEEVLLTLPNLFGIGNQQRFFFKENDTSLATQLNFILNYEPYQLDDITLGNFDGDEYTDMLFDRSGWPDFHILEYNPVTNNFDSVYRFDVSESAPWDEGGYSIGDFDLDGKTDVVFGTGKGNVFVIENEGNNQYTNSWQSSIESNHAYIHTSSNDIDKNGKPEFWVLGDAYYNGIGTTRITIFETNGDNSYYAVGRVDLVGVFSFYAGTMQAFDIDNDGTEEIAICIDDNFLILKFNGSENKQTYEVYYIKQNELPLGNEFQTYFGSTMYDLKNNGESEILISMAHTIQEPYLIGRFVTKIYKPDSTTRVNDDEILSNFTILYQNYPSPFNPTTTVKFSIGHSKNISIKIYNVLGKEIKQLLQENLPAGEHTVQWNGKDDKGNNLTNGVYFIQMIAGSYQKTIKTILLK